MRRTLERLAMGTLLAFGAAGLVVGAQSGDPTTITGVVTSGAGPEAGVWVIAETGDLPTKFRKIVVTGRRRPVPAAGASGGELLGLGARLRARRFDADHGRAG